MNGNKSCDSSCPCVYRYMNSGTIGYGCNYSGYCDFQRPRDSRMQPSAMIGTGICSCAGPQGNDGYCIVCHLLKKESL